MMAWWRCYSQGRYHEQTQWRNHHELQQDRNG